MYDSWWRCLFQNMADAPVLTLLGLQACFQAIFGVLLLAGVFS